MENIEERFVAYLERRNYSRSALVQYSVYAGDLLSWIRSSNKRLGDLSKADMQQYWESLLSRPNKRGSAGLSTAYLNSHMNGLKAFIRFCRLMEGISLFDGLSRIKRDIEKSITILSRLEIQKLYQAAQVQKGVYKYRDRALLGILYGCGLRKSEASALDVGDIDLEKHVLCVTKGKGGKSRYVPINLSVGKDLEAYLTKARPVFYTSLSESAFFIGKEGKRMSSFYSRIAILCSDAGIVKEVSTHTFRHSIATHLMQQGMRIEQIAQFLGHSSLESTQIYTHIVYEQRDI